MIDLQELKTILMLIAEGCKTEGVKDRYIKVENPEYRPNSDEDPYYVIDTWSLETDYIDEDGD